MYDDFLGMIQQYQQKLEYYRQEIIQFIFKLKYSQASNNILMFYLDYLLKYSISSYNDAVNHDYTSSRLNIRLMIEAYTKILFCCYFNAKYKTNYNEKKFYRNLYKFCMENKNRARVLKEHHLIDCQVFKNVFNDEDLIKSNSQIKEWYSDISEEAMHIPDFFEGYEQLLVNPIYFVETAHHLEKNLTIMSNTFRVVNGVISSIVFQSDLSIQEYNRYVLSAGGGVNNSYFNNNKMNTPLINPITFL